MVPQAKLRGHEIGWYLKGCPNLGTPLPDPFSMVQSVVINFSSLLKKFTKRVTLVVYLSLGSYILSRSMEADILKSKKDIYLVQKYGGQYV